MGFCKIENSSTFYLNDLEANRRILMPYGIHLYNIMNFNVLTSPSLFNSLFIEAIVFAIQ